jgi:hypothetical protein
MAHLPPCIPVSASPRSGMRGRGLRGSPHRSTGGSFFKQVENVAALLFHIAQVQCLRPNVWMRGHHPEEDGLAVARSPPYQVNPSIGQAGVGETTLPAGRKDRIRSSPSGEWSHRATQCRPWSRVWPWALLRYRSVWSCRLVVTRNLAPLSDCRGGVILGSRSVQF